MKILLVVDGSSYSDIATKTLEALSLPLQTEVTVMTVVPEHTFLGGITLSTLRGKAPAKEKTQKSEKTAEMLKKTVQTLNASGFIKVESLVRWGNPAQTILEMADKINVSLIVMGAKGLSDTPTFRIGSVTQRVMKHAEVSVLVAKKRTIRVNQGLPPGETAPTIDRVLLATDGSRYSDMATQFLLDLPLPQQTQVIVVTAIESHVEAMMRMPAVDFRTNQQLLDDLQEAEEKEAQHILDKVETKLKRERYSTVPMIMRGGASESILKAAEEYDPNIIALGARGLTGVGLFLLGSVSERIARHAPCSVLIVKPPKV